MDPHVDPLTSPSKRITPHPGRLRSIPWFGYSISGKNRSVESRSETRRIPTELEGRLVDEKQPAARGIL